ncbi:MAG: hypothetical protein JKX76_02745, partial [Colwellia sp.]|nr:hypothetical protein [Colwellia sp.]
INASDGTRVALTNGNQTIDGVKTFNADLTVDSAVLKVYDATAAGTLNSLVLGDTTSTVSGSNVTLFAGSGLTNEILFQREATTDLYKIEHTAGSANFRVGPGSAALGLNFTDILGNANFSNDLAVNGAFTVNGAFNLTSGTLTSGFVLTTNASGVGTWQTLPASSSFDETAANTFTGIQTFSTASAGTSLVNVGPTTGFAGDGSSTLAMTVGTTNTVDTNIISFNDGTVGNQFNIIHDVSLDTLVLGENGGAGLTISNTGSINVSSTLTAATGLVITSGNMNITTGQFQIGGTQLSFADVINASDGSRVALTNGNQTIDGAKTFNGEITIAPDSGAASLIMNPIDGNGARISFKEGVDNDFYINYSGAAVPETLQFFANDLAVGMELSLTGGVTFDRNIIIGRGEGTGVNNVLNMKVDTDGGANTFNNQIQFDRDTTNQFNITHNPSATVETLTIMTDSAVGLSLDNAGKATFNGEFALTSGTLTSGFVLTTDASGNGTWQTTSSTFDKDVDNTFLGTQTFSTDGGASAVNIGSSVLAGDGSTELNFTVGTTATVDTNTIVFNSPTAPQFTIINDTSNDDLFIGTDTSVGLTMSNLGVSTFSNDLITTGDFTVGVASGNSNKFINCIADGTNNFDFTMAFKDNTTSKFQIHHDTDVSGQTLNITTASGGLGLSIAETGGVTINAPLDAQGSVKIAGSAGAGFVLTDAANDGIGVWTEVPASGPLSLGTRNTGIGTDILVAVSGTDNTATGFNALNTITSGNFNTAFGSLAAASAGATVTNMTAIGYNALNVNTAINNTAVGSNTLAVNTSGTDNIGMGYNALVANTTGFNNLAIGTNSLSSMIDGNDQLAIGSNTLTLATSNANIAIGNNALKSVTGGFGNTAIGKDVLELATGNRNTVVGTNACDTLTTGSDNTVVGYQVDISGTIGGNSILGASCTSAFANCVILGGGSSSIEANSFVLGQIFKTVGTSDTVTQDFLKIRLQKENAEFFIPLESSSTKTSNLPGIANTWTNLQTFGGDITINKNTDDVNSIIQVGAIASQGGSEINMIADAGATTAAFEKNVINFSRDVSAVTTRQFQMTNDTSVGTLVIGNDSGVGLNFDNAGGLDITNTVFKLSGLTSSVGRVLTDVLGNGIATWVSPTAFDPSTAFTWTANQVFTNEQDATSSRVTIGAATITTGDGGSDLTMIVDSLGTNKNNTISFLSEAVTQFILQNDTSLNTTGQLFMGTTNGDGMTIDDIGNTTFSNSGDHTSFTVSSDRVASVGGDSEIIINRFSQADNRGFMRFFSAGAEQFKIGMQINESNLYFGADNVDAFYIDASGVNTFLTDTFFEKLVNVKNTVDATNSVLAIGGDASLGGSLVSMIADSSATGTSFRNNIVEFIRDSTRQFQISNNTEDNTQTGSLLIANNTGIGLSFDNAGKATFNGEFALTTGAIDGYVLTTDASGNATWQASPDLIPLANTWTALQTFDADIKVYNSGAVTSTATIGDLGATASGIDALLVLEIDRDNLNNSASGFIKFISNVHANYSGIEFISNDGGSAQDTFRVGPGNQGSIATGLVFQGYTGAAEFKNDLTITGPTIISNTLAITTGAIDGYVLTTDASGNATWQETAASDGILAGTENTGIGEAIIVPVGGTGNTAVGFNSLTVGAEGFNNTALGGNTLKALVDPVSVGVDSRDNTAVGYNAGVSITTGHSNVAIGVGSLATITTRDENVAVGMSALGAQDTGFSNVAVGHEAGLGIVGGNANTFLGYNTGKFGDMTDCVGIGFNSLRINTGGENLAIGSNTLSANTTGTRLVAIGFASGLSNITGTDNTYVGHTAGQSGDATGVTAVGALSCVDNSGDFVTALGYNSGNTNTANNITALGYNALSVNGGPDNTAVGYNSLSSNSTGTANVAIGSGSMSGNLSGINNVAIGLNSMVSGTINKRCVAVGVSTLSNNSSDELVAIGAFALGANSTGTANTGVGFSTLGINSTGNNNTAVGYDALSSTTGSNCTAVGASALASSITNASANNTAVGHLAGTLTTGINNTYLGYSVGSSGVGADDCIGIGSSALLGNLRDDQIAIGNNALAAASVSVSGGSNIAIGHSTLKDNHSGTGNIAIGANVMRNVTEGSQNTIIGTGSLDQQIESDFNTIIGSSIMSFVTATGFNSNTCIGHNCIRTTSGNSSVPITEIVTVGAWAFEGLQEGSANIAIGFEAGQYVSQGANNTFIGHKSATSTGGKLPVVSNNTTLGANTLNIFDDGADQNTVIGSQSLVLLTTGARNTTLGYNTGATMTTVSDVVAIGAGAYALGTAAEITAIGSQALAANTSGTANTAIGFNALSANTTGINNLAIGHGALATSITASENVAIGSSTMGKLTTGDNNVAVGNSCMIEITSGLDNAAFGHNALRDNVIGNNNTAFGSGAMANLESDESCAFGAFTLNATVLSGILNTAIGTHALRNITSGDNNTAVGWEAMRGCTAGGNNVAVGWEALSSTNVGNSNVAIGLRAGSTSQSSNNVFVGSGAGKISTTGINNVIVGKDAQTDSGSSGNTVLGALATANIDSTIDATDNVVIGVSSTANGVTGAVVLGANANAANDGDFVLGGSVVPTVGTIEGNPADFLKVTLSDTIDYFIPMETSSIVLQDGAPVNATAGVFASTKFVDIGDTKLFTLKFNVIQDAAAVDYVVRHTIGNSNYQVEMSPGVGNIGTNTQGVFYLTQNIANNQFEVRLQSGKPTTDYTFTFRITEYNNIGAFTFVSV